MKKVVECLCVMASAADSEANGLSTAHQRPSAAAARRKGLVLGEGFYLVCRSLLEPFPCLKGKGRRKKGRKESTASVQQLVCRDCAAGVTTRGL